MKNHRYKLGRKVEAGRICTIYNALDVQHSKTVIVKVFNKALSKNQAFQNHFRDVTERLVHKTLANNVHLLDTYVNDNACVIVTNYYPYSTQRQESLPKYSEDKIIEIGKGMAASLSQLHNLGIVHGGVELSNIYFLDSGEVILGPVALHRTMPDKDKSHLESQSVLDAVCLAPEANAGLTTSSDFFSLGVVLYELLVGKKPFNTDTKTELEQQKKSGIYLSLNDELAYLNPLFNGLLSPNPESRIASDEQFNSILNACRMDITRASHDAPGKQVDVESASKTTQPTTVTNGKEIRKSALLLAAVVTLVIGVATVLFLISSKDETPQRASEQKRSSVIAKKPEPITEVPTMAQKSQGQTEAIKFYAKAMALVQEGDYDTALQEINHALAIEKDNGRSEKLKNEIEHELKIRSFIATAEQQLEDEKLIKPPGDNALETYLRAANTAPAGDERALSGIQKIADRYLELAKEQINKHNLDGARKAIAQGLLVNSNYGPLLELQSSLAGKNGTKDKIYPQSPPEQASLAQVKQQSIVTGQSEINQKITSPGKRGKISHEAVTKAKEKKSQIQQQQREERARALEAKRRADQLRAEQQRELAAREAEITLRLITAEQQLASKPLSWLTLDTADNEYKALVKIADKDSRVYGLYRKIVDSHITLANRQMNAAQLSESMLTVNRGLVLDGANKKLLVLKNEITNAIKKSEKKHIELPVIGTF